MMKIPKLALILAIPALLFLSGASAEEGDFFFAPEVGWSHLFSNSIKEGVYTGAHFGYDTSDNLSLELLFYYGDNNGESAAPDLRYILGGGGISYKRSLKSFKPSLFIGANIVSLDFSNVSAVTKGGLYFGGAIEYYLNKVVSIGLSYKFVPLFKSKDISLLGFRFGFEL